MKYKEFKISAQRHIESCYHILNNLTNSNASFRKQKEDRLVLNIYYLSGYAIECSIKFAFFKAIDFDEQTDIELLNHASKNDTYVFPDIRGSKSLKIHRLDGLRGYLEDVHKSLPRDIPFITQSITNLSHKALTNKWNSEIRYSPDFARTTFSIDSLLIKEYLDDVVTPIFDKLTKS